MSSENVVHIRPRRKGLYKWTGFSHKSLWDWLQFLGMLAIPATIVFGLLWFSTELSQMEISISEAISQQHRQTNLQIAKDQEQEAILDTYLDRISALVLDNNLANSTPSDTVRKVARDRTLATLLRVDGIRKGIILQFLYQSGLIMKGDVKVILLGADLSGAKLRGVELAAADLTGANLSGADLTGADLTATILINTNLRGATMPDGSIST